MSPKFFKFLCVLYFATAAALMLGGLFTMFTVVVYGFIAFGLVFTGMMCVLPGVVGHHQEVNRNADPALLERKPIKVKEQKVMTAYATLKSA